MKVMKIILFLIIAQNIFSEGSLIEKIKDIQYTNNIEKRQLNELCVDLSSKSGVLIVANEKVKRDFIKLKKGKEEIYNLLTECCKKNGYKLEENEKYIYITNNGMKFSDKGLVIGSVYNKKYKNNLEGVEIKILGNHNKKYLSDKNGKFILENIPYGVYFISLKKEGYITEGEILEVNKKNNLVEVSMEQKDLEERNSYRKKDDFIIKKVKMNNLKEIDLESLLQEKKDMVSITKNLKENIIYLSGEKEKVEKIKGYLNSVDNNNKQVRITAEIIDITENLFDKLGFYWSYDESLNQEDNNFKINILNNDGIIGIGEAYSTFGNLLRTFKSDKEFLKFSFDLLETTQDLKITSVPSIVTVNGREGKIKITEEKIVGEEKEERENNKIIYTPIFKEAGIVLKVVPEIIDDELINLKLELEASDFKVSNIKSSKLGNSENEINGGSKVSRNLKTTLKIKDGSEILIGGLKKNILKKEESKVPGLSSIPVIGKLFKYKTNKKERVDLYIKLKVDIIKNHNKY